MFPRRLTTVASISAVLAAGATAALINTRVLGASGSAATPATLPQRVAATSTAVPPSADGTSTTTPVSAAATSTQAAYPLGDAGVLVLDTAGETLTIVSVTPNPGWEVLVAERRSDGSIAVSLASGTTVIDFNASLLYGIVSSATRTRDRVGLLPIDTAPTSASAVPAGNPTVSGTPGAGGSAGTAPTATASTVAPNPAPTTTRPPTRTTAVPPPATPAATQPPTPTTEDRPATTTPEEDGGNSGKGGGGGSGGGGGDQTEPTEPDHSGDGGGGSGSGGSGGGGGDDD